jgi:hypothetical protein
MQSSTYTPTTPIAQRSGFFAPFYNPQGSSNTSFFESNGMISKFVFLILVIIVFLFFLKIGISLIGYFTRAPSNPDLVKGMISGSQATVITRDPSSKSSVLIRHSNNQDTGMEFTWSVWINLNANTKTATNYSHIFSVGNPQFNTTTGIATVSNGPGLYLLNKDENGRPVTYATLHVIMDTIPDGVTFSQSADITKIPYGKWVHVAIRLENTIMDTYINGVISNRIQFVNVPKQNYENVLICQNGGFDGNLSNLKYYEYALNVFEIMSLSMGGPSTSKAILAADAAASSSTSINSSNFLSQGWYQSKLNVAESFVSGTPTHHPFISGKPTHHPFVSGTPTHHNKKIEK